MPVSQGTIRPDDSIWTDCALGLQLGTDRRACRKIEGGLALFVPPNAVRAPLQQQANGGNIAALGRNDQGGAAAIVDSVDRCGAVEQQSNDGLRSAWVHPLFMPGRPHQGGEAVAVRRVD